MAWYGGEDEEATQPVNTESEPICCCRGNQTECASDDEEQYGRCENPSRPNQVQREHHHMDGVVLRFEACSPVLVKTETIQFWQESNHDDVGGDEASSGCEQCPSFEEAVLRIEEARF